MATTRQAQWLQAAQTTTEAGRALFLLAAQPNEHERCHSCIQHACGFRTQSGRRGFRCGLCRGIVKWTDADTGQEN
jgi:hypothetical protein